MLQYHKLEDFDWLNAVKAGSNTGSKLNNIFLCTYVCRYEGNNNFKIPIEVSVQ